MVYYMGSMLPADGKGMTIVRGLSIVILLPGLYDVLWKRAFKGKETAGVAVTTLAVIGVVWYLASFLPARAAFIHLGAMFGTAMAMNVWMRIWPSQQKIIAAVRDGQKPDDDVVALAALRSKHNTYMSVPLLFTMVSNHHPLFYSYSAGDMSIGWVLLVVLILAGWGCTKLLYNKAGSVQGM
jgi:uncharacterized membrane protein